MTEYIALLHEYGFCTLIFMVGLSISAPLLKRWAESTTFFTHKTQKPNQLIKHSFFSQMNFWRKIGIEAIHIAEPAKEVILKDFLHIQFRIFHEMMKAVVVDKKILGLSQFELKQSLSLLATDGIKKYEQEALSMGIPDVLIKKFAKWHFRSIIFMLNGIEECCVNTYCKTTTARLNGVLGVLLVVFNATIIDAERTLNDLNGDLKGLTYKGLTVSQ